MRDLFDQRPTLTIPRLPCACGSATFLLTPAKGPHAAGLRCATCGHFHRWMSKVEFDHWQEINRAS